MNGVRKAAQHLIAFWFLPLARISHREISPMGKITSDRFAFDLWGNEKSVELLEEHFRPNPSCYFKHATIWWNLIISNCKVLWYKSKGGKEQPHWQNIVARGVFRVSISVDRLPLRTNHTWGEGSTSLCEPITSLQLYAGLPWWSQIHNTVFSLINAPHSLTKPKLLDCTKMTTVSLIMVRFSIQNHHWKAQNVSYHANPLVLAPGAFIRENMVHDILDQGIINIVSEKAKS